MEDFKGEIWRGIPEYEEYYQVSNLGRVRSIGNYDKKGRFRIGCLLSIHLCKKGYNRVQLCFGKAKSFRVARLVARAFPEICGEWFEGCTVDHINTIRNDDRAINLRIVSLKENCNNPLTKSKFINRGKESGIPVSQYTLDNVFIKNWDSFKQIHRILGFNTFGIKQCCKGIFKQSKGFKWKYAS